jgi:hypothetical protein
MPAGHDGCRLPPASINSISASHVPVAGQMYLTKGSYLYVKWDYGDPIDNTERSD